MSSSGGGSNSGHEFMSGNRPGSYGNLDEEDEEEEEFSGSRGGRLAAGGALLACCALERVFFKFGADAASSAKVQHEILFVAPYVAVNGVGFVFATLATMLFARLVEWRLKTLESGHQRWSEGVAALEASEISASSAAIEGAYTFPRRQLATMACLDVLQLSLAFASVVHTPRVLVVLLMHFALPVETLCDWIGLRRLSCRSPSSRRSSINTSSSSSNEHAYLQAPSNTNPSPGPIELPKYSHEYHHSDSGDVIDPPPPLPRHRVLASLVITFAIFVAFAPRIITVIVNLHLHNHHRARHAIRRCFASLVFALSTLPAHFSAEYKERALRAHAQPVAHCHLNAALAAWQLAVSIIVLPLAYAGSTSASNAYSYLSGEVPRFVPLHVAAERAWKIHNLRPLRSPMLFFYHLAFSGLARVALSAAMRRGGDALVYSAIAGSVPVAGLVLALSNINPKAMPGDILATALISVGLVVYYRRPPEHSRFLTHWATTTNSPLPPR